MITLLLENKEEIRLGQFGYMGRYCEQTILGALLIQVPAALIPILIHILILIPVLIPQAHGQSGRDATITQIGSELLTLIEDNISKKDRLDVGNNMGQLDGLYNLTDPRYQLAGHQMAKGYQADQIAKDWGINLKAQYFVNYDPLFDDDETNAETAYGNRGRVGIEWELLRGGLIGNQRRAKNLRNEEALEALKYDIGKNDERLFLRYNIIIYLFNEAKIKLLKESIAQVQKELELLYKVYFLKGILYEEILKAKSRIDQIKVQLENYESYNRTIAYTLDIPNLKEKFQYEALPVLEVNLDYLMADESGAELLDSLTQMEEKIQNSRNRAFDEVSLRFQLYQYVGAADNLSLIQKSYMAGGFSLTVPTEILFDNGSRKKLAQERVRERVKFDNYEHLNQKTEIINYYYEYNYKLKTYMEFMYKEMLYQERVRIDIISHKDFEDIHRSLRILRNMDALRSIRLEMIDLKQQMYLLLLKIYGNTHYRSILPAVNTIDIASYYQRLPAKRSIVMGYDILKNYDERFVVHYLMSNGVEAVMLENGQSISSTLMAILEENKIAIWSSVDGARMIQSADGGARHIVDALMVKDYNGVELDFSGMKSNKAAQDYLASNMGLIGKGEGNVSVKIGKGFSRELMATLLKTTDRLTIKMNKPSDLDGLREIAALSAGNGKLGISLHAKAFKNRMELEAYIDMANSVYGVDHVLIDDLDDYMSLDTKTLARAEE